MSEYDLRLNGGLYLGNTTATITYGGVTFSNSVTGTGSVVLSNNPTLTGNVTITSIIANGTTGSAGLGLVSNSTGGLYWGTVSGGSGTPSGANTNVQFNSSGTFGGTAGFTFDSSSNTVYVANAVYIANSIVTPLGQSYAIAAGYALP